MFTTLLPWVQSQDLGSKFWCSHFILSQRNLSPLLLQYSRQYQYSAVSVGILRDQIVSENANLHFPKLISALWRARLPPLTLVLVCPSGGRQSQNKSPSTWPSGARSDPALFLRNPFISYPRVLLQRGRYSRGSLQPIRASSPTAPRLRRAGKPCRPS